MATEFKLSYTGNQINEKLKKIDNLADKSELPTKTSDLTNDSGFLTSYTETDPTVPAWAKNETKPTYTASEVGADASGTANSLISTHNSAADAHADIRAEFTIMTNEFDLINNKITTLSNNKLNASELTEAVNDALAQAKDSGEFDGKDGTSVTVKSASESTADGGSNVVTFSDGKTLNVKNGKAGTPGKTPVRGVDYYTEADKAEFSEYIASELAKRGQLKPEFANSIEECTDTTKLYVLPDGYIYAYMLTEVESKPSYTNVLPLAVNADGTPYVGTNGEKGYKTGWRLNSSRVEKEQADKCCTGFIPVKHTDKIRFKNIHTNNSSLNGYIFFYNSDFSNNAGMAYEFENIWDSVIIPSQIKSLVNTATNATDTTAYMRISTNAFDDTAIITINEEIVESSGSTTTEYAWANTGRAFVPADYEDRILSAEAKINANAEEIANLKEDIIDTSLMFIAPDGNDNNDGLTVNTPKKTVKACVTAGAKRISAKRGVYKEFIELSNISELEIFPTDNDLAYAVGEEREPIVFDTSDNIAVSSLDTYNSIKRVAYTNSANTQFDNVFTKKSLTPIVGDGYGSTYNSTIWLLSSDERDVCIKLKPVLTVAECEAEVNTFTYVSGYVYIHADMIGVEKIIVPTNWGTGFYINGADRLVLKEVEVRFSGTYNIDIRNCAYFDFYKCACKYTSYGSGFHPFNSNGHMTACYATKNYDGYGISGYGHTTYVDCVSEFNFDDGMSHHNGTSGTVIGGRYEGNGKGGNTPAYGAKVNIYGGLYKDNASFGIGYLWATDLEPASGMVQGAVMVGNPKGLVIGTNCHVTAIDCIYKDNAADKEIKGDFTEINGIVSNDETNEGNGSIESGSGYTNVLPLAINVDSTPYVGTNGEKGYKSGWRINSSLAEVEATNRCCTGFIPVKYTDEIRFKNINNPSDGDCNGYIRFYNSDFTVNKGMAYEFIGIWDKVIIPSQLNSVSSTAVNATSSVAYMRISAGNINNSSIITINEEIVDSNDTTSGTENGTENIKSIKDWDAPIYDANIPVFQLSAEKTAMTNATNTPDSIYAKYDALMAKHPRYITKTDLGLCSDGVNHVYRYDFREPDPHYESGKAWSETKTKAILMTGIHFEWAGIYSMYYALEEIADNPELRNFRRNTHLIVVPVANPYATLASNYDVSGNGHQNANGVEIHRNFEVDWVLTEEGTTHYGGSEPLSEVETQYIDNILKNNTDAALFLSAHNCGVESVWGTGFIWSSTATKYMCNMGFRLVDKLSDAWMDKYGDVLSAGIAEYKTDALEDGDTRLGWAGLSTSPGTEAKQATKYGIQGTNIETCNPFQIHGTKAKPEQSMSSFTMSRGAEVYVNFLLTAFGVYDPKDKTLYS